MPTPSMDMAIEMNRKLDLSVLPHMTQSAHTVLQQTFLFHLRINRLPTQICPHPSVFCSNESVFEHLFHAIITHSSIAVEVSDLFVQKV